MTRTSFTLDAPLRGDLDQAPPAVEYRLDLCGLGLVVGLGQEVLAGQKLAVAEAGWTGDLHSPVAGSVEKITGDQVVVAADPAEPHRKAEPVSLSGAPDELLLTALSGLGLDIRGLFPARDLVINAVDPEPGVTAFTRILAAFPEELAAGLELARTLTRPSRTILVTAEGREGTLAGTETRRVPARYPAGLDALAGAAATGRENDPGTCILGVDRLLNLGRAALRGEPVTTTVCTVAGRDWLVPVGAPASSLLSVAGLDPGRGDRVILGGPLRGEAQYDIDAPVPKRTYAAGLVRRRDFPPVTTRPCLNCGQCVLACPARIPVALMTRYAEYGLFQKALDHDLDACVGCGLCAYVCPARRPLMQFIQLAKASLVASGFVSGPERLTPGLRPQHGYIPERDKGHAAKGDAR